MRIAVSMRSVSSLAFSPPTGCFTTTSFGVTRRALACARTSGRNVSVATMMAVTPRFSSSMLSWKLHDEQDPQSPKASSAIRYLCATSSIMPGGAGWLALPLAM